MIGITPPIVLYYQCLNKDFSSVSQVYDLSSFLDDHPGGDDVILSATGENSFFDILHVLCFSKQFSLLLLVCMHANQEISKFCAGKDATNDFEDVGHSDDARDMMEKYYVGEIDSSSIPAEVHKPTPGATPTRRAAAAAGSSTENQTSENIIKLLQFLLPLFILVLAYAYRQYTKKE